jgi:hypothetical protein
MADRRSLTEGLKQISPEADPDLAERFVFGDKPKRAAPAKEAAPAATAPEPDKTASSQALGRTPLTIRFRADSAAALKRASLERQLKGVQPCRLQDIVEEAVEPWLRANGYLK